MHALRNIHAALVPGGLIIDTQPVSLYAPVETPSGRLGELDTREWARLIEAVDDQVEVTLRAGLFNVQAQRQLVVADWWSNGAEAIDRLKNWTGTRIDEALAERVAAEPGEVRVSQDVRLRVYIKPSRPRASTAVRRLRRRG